jgi:hypothetical protein
MIYIYILFVRGESQDAPQHLCTILNMNEWPLINNGPPYLGTQWYWELELWSKYKLHAFPPYPTANDDQTDDRRTEIQLDDNINPGCCQWRALWWIKFCSSSQYKNLANKYLLHVHTPWTTIQKIYHPWPYEQRDQKQTGLHSSGMFVACCWNSFSQWKNSNQRTHSKR